MFDKLAYKQRLKGVGILAVASLFICYQFGIRRTLAEYNKVKELERTDTTALAGIDLDNLALQDVKLTRLYDRFLLDTLASEKNLLFITGNFCKTIDLRLKEYKPVGLHKEENRQVLTRLIRVEGGFISCLKLLYELETKKNAGRVGSAEFRSYKDTQDKSIKMECIIYVQNIISD
jgi:hypothetical protein